MDLELDRKEIFLISVIILMILAWTIGNLGGAYFGMEDEEIENEPARPHGTHEGTPVRVPDFLGDILFVTVIIGSVAWFLFSDEGWKSKSIRGAAFLIMISIFYFLEDISHIFRPISSRFVGILSDMEYYFVPDIGNGSDPIFSPVESSIGLLVFLISVLVVIFLYFRHKKLSEQTIEAEEDISSTADKAITELHEGRDVRDIIIRNYQKMLIILEKEGVKQEISFTPRELEKVAINKLKLTEATIDEMTKLFEEAKYSDHPLGEKERNRAIANFKRIKKELEGIKNA